VLLIDLHMPLMGGMEVRVQQKQATESSTTRVQIARWL
jgi:CheY-like chemotaxis protein